MTYPYSLVIVAPAEHWASFSQMAEAAGYALGEGIPLSADGSEPPTHLGLHTWAQQSFVDWISTPPEIPGIDQSGIDALHALMAISSYHKDADGALVNRAHFDSVCQAEGVRPVVVEE